MSHPRTSESKDAKDATREVDGKILQQMLDVIKDKRGAPKDQVQQKGGTRGTMQQKHEAEPKNNGGGDHKTQDNSQSVPHKDPGKEPSQRSDSEQLGP